MSEYSRLLEYFLIFINFAGFVTVGIDKYKSIRRLWRIPERLLFWFAIIGGSVGVYAGVLTFRHKTKHWYFMYGIPFIFFIQILIVYMLIK